MEELDYEVLVKATDNFDPTRLIGKGSHGMVYRGLILGEDDDGGKVVAIKKPSRAGVLKCIGDNSSKLENEIRVLSCVVENPHVVKVVGTSHDPVEKNKVLVMEFMPNGSLHDLLHSNNNGNGIERSEMMISTWPKRVEIAMQIARAVWFLHEGKTLVIHRDIKSSNILLDSSWNARLVDFGLAVLPLDSCTRSQPAGTIGYLDPCYTTPSKLSTKNDIFSLGVVLLEIFSSRKAIDIHKSPASIVDWAMPLIKEQRFGEICDNRLALPAYMMAGIRHILCIAASCLSPNEESRPSIGEIVRGMEGCSFVERFRFKIWTSVVRGMIFPRKRRELITNFCKKNMSKRWSCLYESYVHWEAVVIERGLG